MTQGQYAMVLVHSTNHAIRAEKLMAEGGVACKLIPVPRQISSDCGVCVRVARLDRQAAEQILADAGVEIAGVYDV